MNCSYCANMLHFDKDFLGLEQWGKNLQSSTVIFEQGQHAGQTGQHIGQAAQLGSCAAERRAGQNL